MHMVNLLSSPLELSYSRTVGSNLEILGWPKCSSFSIQCYRKTWTNLLLLLLSRFSRVRLRATHRQPPTGLLCPWDSPGKNTGVGCHFFLQCMKVKSESEVAQSCPTLSDLIDWSLPGSSIHGIFQARVLEWGAIAFEPNEPFGQPKILNSNMPTIQGPPWINQLPQASIDVV